jgi:catechol 2,3-dioxygenase-like lactoylglutathione lyase family enzyme|tara:strand:- start:1388 stop:1858 length:471 start_codon:yes stop_codon:yes gene_type:complete
VKPRGIHHVGLVVDDLEAAIAFYSALLDMIEVERDHWTGPAPVEDQVVGLVGSSADGVMLKGAASYLELWQYKAPSQMAPSPDALGANECGLRHLAIEVDDVSDSLERLIELGGTKMGDPVTLDETGAAAVYCRDPFGTIIEFMSVGDTMASLDHL